MVMRKQDDRSWAETISSYISGLLGTTTTGTASDEGQPSAMHDQVQSAEKQSMRTGKGKAVEARSSRLGQKARFYAGPGSENATFVIVSPAEKITNHPLSMQLQWVPLGRPPRRPSPSHSCSVSPTGSQVALALPRRSLHPTQSEDEINVTFDEHEAESSPLRPLTLYSALSTASGSGGAQRRSSVSSARSSKKRPIPLYQLHFHNILPTTITRFEDDTKVAKISRHGLEMRKFGMLRAEDISASAKAEMSHSKASKSFVARHCSRRQLETGNTQATQVARSTTTGTKELTSETADTALNTSIEERRSARNFFSRSLFRSRRPDGGTSCFFTLTKDKQGRDSGAMRDQSEKEKGSKDAAEMVPPRQAASRYVWRFKSRRSRLSKLSQEICFEWREVRTKADPARSQVQEKSMDAAERKEEARHISRESSLSTSTNDPPEASTAKDSARDLDISTPLRDSDSELGPNYLCHLHIAADDGSATQSIPLATLSPPRSPSRALAQVTLVQPLPNLVLSHGPAHILDDVDLAECVLCMSLWIVAKTSDGYGVRAT